MEGAPVCVPADSPFRRVEAVRGDITTEQVGRDRQRGQLLAAGRRWRRRRDPPGRRTRLLAACREVRPDAYPDGLPVGDAVATTGADLPARMGDPHGRPQLAPRPARPGPAAPLLHPVAGRGGGGRGSVRGLPRRQRRRLRMGAGRRGRHRRRRRAPDRATATASSWSGSSCSARRSCDEFSRALTVHQADPAG